jgi:hypothetical protein
MEALLGPQMALVQSAFLSKVPSDAMRSILFLFFQMIMLLMLFQPMVDFLEK